MEEDEVIRSAQSGDQEAITWLVETYQQPVYRVCCRILGDWTEAEDATQEALIKAINNLERFDTERPFKPWVLRIASNECTDRLRRRKSTLSLDGMGEDGAWEWQAGHSPNPERQLLESERLAQVQQLLETLSPQDRLVVMLFYWEDLSYEEISQTTELSVAAVKSRLFRARRAMAGQLVEEGVYA